MGWCTAGKFRRARLARYRKSVLVDISIKRLGPPTESLVTTSWATSEISVAGAGRDIVRASRYEKKYRPRREQLERGSGSLGFASWAHNLSARMELKARGGCPNQTNLLIGHKAIATTVLWYCPGLTSPLTRNCEWTRLVSESRSFSPVFSPPFPETEIAECHMSAIGLYRDS